jgi:hypothetical protein
MGNEYVSEQCALGEAVDHLGEATLYLGVRRRLQTKGSVLSAASGSRADSRAQMMKSVRRALREAVGHPGNAMP